MENRILKRYPLGNPRRNWKQEDFILSNFSIKGENTENVVKNLYEAGFNLVECGWASPEEALSAVKACEKLGLGIIFQDMKRYGGMQHNRFYEKNDLEGVIEDLKDYKCVVGYYIWDEPLLDDQIDEARMLTDICEKNAPDKLPFSVAIPSYNTEYGWGNMLFPEYLERYLTRIEPPVLSLDYYPVGMKEHNEELQLDKSRIWCDLSLMKKLAKKYDMPMWFYYQGQNLHNVEFFIFPMVRCMMYAGALYGAKGLQHYTSMGAITTEAGDKDIFFEEQKAIHEEFKNLGKTLMALDCKRVLHDDSLTPPCEIFDQLFDKISDSAYLSEKLPNRVSVSELEDEYGNGYILVLNRDYMKEASFTLKLNDGYRIYEVSKKDGLQYVAYENTSELAIMLAPGDAMLYRVQKADEEAFTIEYRLEK